MVHTLKYQGVGDDGRKGEKVDVVIFAEGNYFY